MNLLLNLIIAVLVFVLVRTLLGIVELDGAVGWLISVIVAIVAFLQDWASRLNR